MLQTKKPLLILDLDETLIFSSLEILPDTEKLKHIVWNKYFIHQRPFLQKFLTEIVDKYKPAVWTSAGDEYAKRIIEFIGGKNLPLEFLWTREKCTYKRDPGTGNEYFLKNLKKVFKLGYPKEKVLIVDDTPENLNQQYGNYIRVQPFRGDKNDRELLRLLKYLQSIVNIENFRSIEKRGWSHSITE
ncbi:HAD family hydrolase [candidate division KSB1 bacterium]|nr:HAD family hydrolase [candidate division KSB1 bacterium]